MRPRLHADVIATADIFMRLGFAGMRGPVPIVEARSIDAIPRFGDDRGIDR